jgi:hypothetical protein
MMATASAPVYIDGATGQSHIDLECEGPNRSFDKSGTGKKLYVGYKLNPIMVLAAAHVDFGKTTRVEGARRFRV